MTDPIVITVTDDTTMASVREQVARALRAACRINIFDAAPYRSLLASAYPATGGTFFVRRGTLAKRFATVEAAAADTARALDVHFSRAEKHVVFTAHLQVAARR
jgi:hypothetical protein